MAEPFSRINKRRENLTALPLYYNGPIQKKFTGSGEFTKYFGELRGSTLFFYTEERHDMYYERLELYNLESMVPITSYSECTAPVYTLTFPHQEIQLKMDNPDTGELWRGYILTVALLEIPERLQLLPGQFLTLREVLSQEKERCLQQSRSARPATVDEPGEYVNTPPVMPGCFMEVSREKAEELLKNYPDSGNIILRPAADKQNYSITTRQAFQSGAVIKNYKVTSNDTGYIIQLDEPVPRATLHEVVVYFMDKTGNKLTPFVRDKAYDTRIEVNPPVAPKPKAAPKARVAPLIRSQVPPRPLPPTPPLQKQGSTDTGYVSVPSMGVEKTKKNPR